jgi:tRNA A-37 threonylcarbamoyl transferase component Bud32
VTQVIDQVTEAVGSCGLDLEKTFPQGAGHLLLQMSRPDRSRLAGQWFADSSRARVVARETRKRSGDDVDVPVLDGGRLLLQPDGADRRIPVLHRVASAPGAALVAHRAEKRGSVRRVDHDGQTVYTKVVRPSHLSATMAGARVRVDGVRVPKVTAVDPDDGTMDCRALPGRTLRDILADPTTTTAEVVAAGCAVGGAVARLHACPPPSSLRRHDATEEMAVTRRWLRQASVHGLLDDTALVRRRLEAARGLLAGTPGESAFLHRDLHDKQVVVDDDGAVGILDLDLAATGEPALDLANLLVHLELRSLQGLCPAARAGACADAVVDGYAPDLDIWRRMPAYALTTRLRLAAVYAFRPGSAGIGLALLTDASGPPGPTRERR